MIEEYMELSPKFNDMFSMKIRILSRSSTIAYMLQQCRWELTASAIGLILERPAFIDQKIILTYEEYKSAKELDEIITILLVRLREEMDKVLLREL